MVPAAAVAADTAAPVAPATSSSSSAAPPGTGFPLPPLPDVFGGWLIKQTHGAWVHWNRRHFMLKEGFLYWAAEEIADDRPETLAKASSMDFTRTPCEVALIGAGTSAARVSLRPLKGHRWPRAAAGHSGAGTSRPLVLTVAGGRREAEMLNVWLHRIQEHILFGQAVAAAKACRSGTYRARGLQLETVAAEDINGGEEQECPVCLELLGADNQSVVRTACGHCFHAACLHEWALRAAVCPLCKGAMTAAKGR
mmetsp:Transcript_67865/g.175958  ORF Transcript_67865/g.175958 Transcript_67865/m.175958 type:complete len:253 (+) Transcript_67865:83-841(+)